MSPPVPPEEIALMMRFLAEKKTKNVKSPMSITGLVTEFKEEIGSQISESGVKSRIEKFRHRIHQVKEFDMDTTVKMIFALSTPIDDEMMTVTDVEVDDKHQLVKYRLKDGEWKLNAENNIRLSTTQREQRDRNIIQLLVKKTKTFDTLMADRCFLREVKTIFGYLDSIDSLEQRLFQDGYVEVGGEGRITKYRVLKGDHSASVRSTAKLKKKCPAEIPIGRKQAREVSEEDYFGKSLKLENDFTMDPYSNNNDNGIYDYFGYHPSHYVEKIDYSPIEKKPESLLEVKIEKPEGPSTSNGIQYYSFDNDPTEYEKNMKHISVEKKPEGLFEID